MKKTLIIFVLLFSSINHLYAKNYISGYSIGEISLGDSALLYYSVEEIKKYSKEIYEDNLYTQFYIASNDYNSEYDGYQIHYKSMDQNYIIEVVTGVKLIDNFNQCVKNKEKIKREIEDIFSIKGNKWTDQDYTQDGTTTSASFYYFFNGDSVDIQCTDWHSSMPYDDSLRVSLWSAEFGEWVSH